MIAQEPQLGIPEVTTFNTFNSASHLKDHTPVAPAAKPAAPDEKLTDTKHPRGGLYDKIEAFVSKLSMRDNFWNAICSLIWLPLAFFSGLRMKEVDANTFVARAILPFRRFNRNWYRAMAGGALLANSEIAGGGYVFGIVGADYTVVCKHLEYKFLRPCFGPAVYRIKARDDVKAQMATGAEFNCIVDMDVLQQAARIGERDKRVGQCVATFHVTPKMQHKVKKLRKSK
jgi:acyl-coenzyme A thioesterase PaaI-like protein